MTVNSAQLHAIMVPAALDEHLRDTDDAEIRGILREGRTMADGSVAVVGSREALHVIADLCGVLAGGEGCEADAYEIEAYAAYTESLAGLLPDVPVVPVEPAEPVVPTPPCTRPEPNTSTVYATVADAIEAGAPKGAAKFAEDAAKHGQPVSVALDGGVWEVRTPVARACWTGGKFNGRQSSAKGARVKPTLAQCRSAVAGKGPEPVVPVVSKDGTREVIESRDGKARYTLAVVPTEDVRPETREAYETLRDELCDVIDAREARTPKWRAKRGPAATMKLEPSADAPGYAATGFEDLGAWLEWTHISMTGVAEDGRSTSTGHPVRGQVWSQAPQAATWYVTTDRSGHTGEYHVMTRSGSDGAYRYSIGGSAVRHAGEPGTQLGFDEMPARGAAEPKPVESYGEWDAEKRGFLPHAPVSAHVGAIEVLGDRVWFPMVIDGVRMDADACGGNEWKITVPGSSRDKPLATCSVPVAKGMVVQFAAKMLRQLEKLAKGEEWGSNQKFHVREVYRFQRLGTVECHECNARPDGATGSERFFEYETRPLVLCAIHLSRKTRTVLTGGRVLEVSVQRLHSIGDAQKVMATQNSLAATAMVAMITGEIDSPAVAEAERAEAYAVAQCEKWAEAAELAATHAEQAAERARQTAWDDVDGCWAQVALAEHAQKDVATCVDQVAPERTAYVERINDAVYRAKCAVDDARNEGNDRQEAADDIRCGLESVREAAESAAQCAESVAEVERWAKGCPDVDGAPETLTGWLADARAEAAKAAEWAQRARTFERTRETRPECWFTLAGGAAEEAREALKEARSLARCAAKERGRADRVAIEQAPDAPAWNAPSVPDAQSQEEAPDQATPTRAVPDTDAAAGRDPMGNLPKAWNDALCDVARGQVHTLDGEWQRITRGWPGRHPKQRALSGLLALGLIIEADDAEHVEILSALARRVTLSRAGVARFDAFGPEIPARAREAANEAEAGRASSGREGGAQGSVAVPASSENFDANASSGAQGEGGEGGLSMELDADASNKVMAQVGEMGSSGKLDAVASTGLREAAVAVAVMPIGWAKPAGRGDCAAANTCGGFGVLLWDVPGCAPRCAECAARVMGHSPAALRALTLPGDVVEAEEEAEAADIVIRHTHEDGTTVEGSSKGDGVWEALKPLGWTYRRNPGIFIRGSRNRNADRWKIGVAVKAVRALGFTCVEQIEETLSFAQREAARVQSAEERSERYDERAGRAAQSSEAARKASDQIGERFWMGQPILVGHHSEGRARRDQERMHNQMRKSIADDKKAGYFASRAEASAAYEKYRKAPGRTLRRMEKLGAERRGVLRERDGVDDRGRPADFWRTAPSPERRAELDRRLAEYDEELTYWAEVIKEAERRGFKVWGKPDFVKGDFVCYRGTWYEVTRVNAKSVTIPHIHASFDGGAVGAVGGRKVVTKAAAVAAGRMGVYTYTANFNDGVSGRMSADQMTAALAGEPLPADPRDATPEPVALATVSAPVPAGVSDPGTAEAWEGEGGAVPGVAVPRGAMQFQGLDASTSIGDATPGDELPGPASEGGPCAFGDMVAVFMASKGGSPARQRVLWWMPRRDAQSVCCDARTSGARFMLCWTAEPGKHGTDWDFVTDDGRFGEVLRDAHARPVTAEGYAERRPGTCHPERWCGHAWPCGRDVEAWQARQPKSRAQLRRKAQAETRAAKAAPPAPVRAAAPVGEGGISAELDVDASIPCAGSAIRHDERGTQCRELPASPVRKAIETGEREPIATPYVPAPRVFEVAPVESHEARQVRALVARLRAAEDVEVVQEQAARNWFEAAVEPVAVVEDREEHQDQDAPVLSWEAIAEELRELRAVLTSDDHKPEGEPVRTWDEVRRELAALRRKLSPGRPVALPVRPVRIPRRLRREALTIAASAALVTVVAGQMAEMMPYRW
ncbi:DUF3560 domain-containing protein [Streptomyces sp. NPDC056486]|uniref:DUF3560 domain-containing protein n=1 Tax=Streptomyces sp. NPDC056486 TaxID=3345835 RepID=UPI0036B93DBE